MKQIDLEKLSLWHIDAAGAALCVLLTLTLYLAGVGPLLQRREDLGARQAELDAQQLKAARLASTCIAVGEQLATLEQSMSAVKIELLPAGQVNRHIAELSDLAAKAGLKIDDIQSGTPVAGARYEMVPIRLAGTGTYVTCLDFLHRLHRVSPDTGVSGLELGGSPSERGGEAQFRFELLWYAAPRSAG